MTQEIIVYRNPAEKAMWDGLSGHPMAIIALVLTIFLSFIILFYLLNMFSGLAKNAVGIALTIAVILGFMAMYATL